MDLATSIPSASDPLLVTILGPTGSGKTELSLKLAERFGGEIVSCDSVAVYRDFVVGTAKPTEQQRRRVPHHLLDILAPGETITAGDYSRRARAAVAEIGDRHRLPVVTGGTGLYLRALLDGLFAGPARSQELRQRLAESARSHPPGHLHRMLSRLDAAAARGIHPNDLSKLARALEVCLSARRPMTRMWSEGRSPLPGFRVLKIGLDAPREALYARLNERARGMFEAGLVEETARLQRQFPGAWPLSSLGYRQCGQLLRGEIDLAAAIAAVQQAHRNYAKRQVTWFRRESGVNWIAGFGDEAATMAAAAGLLERHLPPPDEPGGEESARKAADFRTRPAP